MTARFWEQHVDNLYTILKNSLEENVFTASDSPNEEGTQAVPWYKVGTFKGN